MHIAKLKPAKRFRHACIPPSQDEAIRAQIVKVANEIPFIVEVQVRSTNSDFTSRNVFLNTFEINKLHRVASLQNHWLSIPPVRSAFGRFEGLRWLPLGL